MYYMKKKTDNKKRVTISTNKIKFYFFALSIDN